MPLGVSSAEKQPRKRPTVLFFLKEKNKKKQTKEEL